MRVTEATGFPQGASLPRDRSEGVGIDPSQGAWGMDSKGFSLLEVMIALLILFVGLLGAASMQISSIHGNAMANKMTEASVIASGRAEMLLSLDFDSVALVDGSETVDGYGVTWVVKEGAGGANTRDITVMVSWRMGDKDHTVDYRFLKVKNI